MTTYIIKYCIYFKKIELQQKGEIEIEDGVTFRDKVSRTTIIVDADNLLNYVSYLYEKDITNIIKVPQEIRANNTDIDFSNKDTNLVLEKVF